MKIVIITIHGYFNYGNRLQNYALQTVLKKHHDDVSTWAVSRDCSWLKRTMKRYVRRVNGQLKVTTIANRKREEKFKKFSDRYITTRMFYSADGRLPKAADQDVDIFVVGSDQVWNPLFWADCDESADLYNNCLGFTQKKKIAYAASFGVGAIPEKWSRRMQPLLSAFSNISVRESEGVTILREMGCEAEVVLDPTMLLTAEEWRAVESNKISEKKKFVLTYFLGKQPEEVWDKIRKETEEKNCTVVNLMDPAGLYYASGPETFLELIDKAECVFTDSFHACIFSMLFHTPFAVFQRHHQNRSDMSSRITTLLASVGIQNGISGDNLVIVEDFENIDERIPAEREKSLRYLMNSLLLQPE